MKPGHRKRFAVSAFCSIRFALTKMRGGLRGRQTVRPRLATKHHRHHKGGSMRTLPLPFLVEQERERHPRRAALTRERFWPADFGHGFRCGLGGCFQGWRTCDGLPAGFPAWPWARRETWLSGFDHGFHYRIHCIAAEHDRTGGGDQ